ncbi:hypothetical protein BC830DRAFT_1083269, partial [Chytriomyces sp. MP71]
MPPISIPLALVWMLELHKPLACGTLVDTCPYMRWQQWRLPFNTKRGKVPLRRVIDSTWTTIDVDKPLLDQEGWGDYTFSKLCAKWHMHNLDDLSILATGNERLISISPGAYPFPMTRHTHQLRMPQPTCSILPTFCQFEDTSYTRRGARDVVSEMMVGPVDEDRVVVARAERSSGVMRDVSIVYRDDMRPVMFKDCMPGDFIFHEECEGLEGTPSAHVANSRQAFTLMFHCFACNKDVFEVPTWSSPPF